MTYGCLYQKTLYRQKIGFNRGFKGLIPGNLSLDAGDDIDAIYYLGDLTVEGDIENYIGESGAGLFVAGKTRAVNIIAGGAVVYLNHVSVNKLCFAHYNDGILNIDTFDCGIPINLPSHAMKKPNFFFVTGPRQL